MQAKETMVLNGTVAIRGGQVIVTDPQPGGKPAVIIPGEKVEIMVNEELLQGPQEVTSQDRVLLIPHISEPHWHAEVRLAPDKMAAYLLINRTPGLRYEIRDEPPALELEVKGHLTEMIKPEVAPEKLREILEAEGVVFGIIPEMLQLAADSEQEGEFLVAQGEPPLPGVDASLRTLFTEKKEDLGSEDSASGPLIHVHEVISVEPGETLVEVIPPQPGKSGIDVLGNPVPPPEPKNITLKAGAGAELAAGGTKAIATITGRPVLQGNTISVVPAYTLSGDVDSKTGFIAFKGDVTIHGNVLDGMKVEAGGKVIIDGYVANATVIAGGDVHIGKNVVGSTVRAGGISAICRRLLTNLALLEKILVALPAAIAQLKRHPLVMKNRDFQRLGERVLLKMLVESKFKKLPGLLEEIGGDLKELEGAMEGEEWEAFVKAHQDFSQKITGRLSPNSKMPGTLNQYLNNFLEQVKVLTILLQERSSEKARLVVPYVQNSHLESSGDVIITGKGCYNSNIYAGENVLVEGSPGVFRGGEIVAGGQVKVRELGCLAETLTKVEIPRGKILTAGRVFPGVTIKAGGRLEKITAEMTNLTYQGL